MMTLRRAVAALLALVMLNCPGVALAADPPPPPSAPPTQAVPPAPPGGQEPTAASDITPARVSYLNGEVSFWRPGGQEWTPAKVNMPLAPGDNLYTGQGGNVEIQVGPRAFLRASEGTHLGLDNQEPDFVQFRVTDGHAALDLRGLAAGQTVELDTPQGAFTVERTGYYHAEVSQESTAFDTHRGGSATVTPAGGAATPVVANQQVVLTGTESPRVEVVAAPALSAWDRWNYQRTDYLLQPASTRYVSPAVYGGEALSQYGSWRTVETYGSVWIPAGVSPDWVPYSTGRWIWDPRFGWTWLDDAPWGWAPYHYGRWISLGSYWAWAPGPVVVRPAYSPALVVFLGGGAVIAARPLYWAPLGWGEPVIPWWGRPGFVGVAWWGGWGGPRVVNNVVVNRTTTTNVTNITVYQNVHVTNAVVGVPADRFGQGQLQPMRVSQAQAQQLAPVRGPLAVRPVAASMQPASDVAVPPSGAIHARPVVATRTPHDPRPALQAQGLTATQAVAPTAPPRLVPSPRTASPALNAPVAPGAGPARTPSTTPTVASPTIPGPVEKRGSAAEGGSEPRKDRRAVATPERGSQQAPSPPARSTQQGMASRHVPPPPPPPPVTRNGAAKGTRKEPQAAHPDAATAPTDRPARVEPPTRRQP